MNQAMQILLGAGLALSVAGGCGDDDPVTVLFITGGTATGGTGGAATGGTSETPTGGTAAGTATGGMPTGGMGTGGVVGTGGGGPGTGGTALDDCQGANDGDPCTALGLGYVCDRSTSESDPRTCTCDGAVFVCVHHGGTGGTGTGGIGSEDCRGADDGDDCAEFGSGYVCDRSTSASDPRVCTCNGSVWTCVRQDAGH
ncbi:MAG: hypothetical protein JW751_18755 [Polyangiaceae bacterium]|nr:hypothetical protein [Polyangiaceae bacterium]